jgi:hypothetical protein
MHDLLFENQSALDDDDLVSYGASAGVRRRRTRDSRVTPMRRACAGLHGGVRSGVNGTPTFFINGLRHDDSFDLPTLKKAIARAPVSSRPSGFYKAPNAKRAGDPVGSQFPGADLALSPFRFKSNRRKRWARQNSWRWR